MKCHFFPTHGKRMMKNILEAASKLNQPGKERNLLPQRKMTNRLHRNITIHRRKFTEMFLLQNDSSTMNV